MKSSPYSFEHNRQLLEAIDSLECSTNQRLKQLGLAGMYSFDVVKNKIIIHFHELSESSKFEYNVEFGCWFYTNEKGETERIRNIRAWLRVVIKNELLKLQRLHKQQLNAMPEFLASIINGRCSAPEDYMEKEELLDKINMLGQEDRKILKLLFFKGLSYRQIANQLSDEGYHYNESTLRKKKERALDKLRKMY